MTTKPESRLQRKIHQTLEKEIGGFWFKVHGGPFQRSGLPDLIGSVDGLFFGLEVKCPDGDEPTPLQKKTLKQIKEKGKGIAVVVTSPQEALDIVQSVRQLSKRGRRKSY